MPSATATDEISHQSAAASLTLRVTNHVAHAPAPISYRPSIHCCLVDTSGYHHVAHAPALITYQPSIRCRLVYTSGYHYVANAPALITYQPSIRCYLVYTSGYHCVANGHQQILANYCPTVGRVTCSLHEKNPLGSPRSCSVCDIVAIVRCGTPTYTWACPH